MDKWYIEMDEWHMITGKMDKWHMVTGKMDK